MPLRRAVISQERPDIVAPVNREATESAVSDFCTLTCARHREMGLNASVAILRPYRRIWGSRALRGSRGSTLRGSCNRRGVQPTPPGKPRCDEVAARSHGVAEEGTRIEQGR